MPLRAPKMYGFIFGFQRLVWWPKCTPASSSWRMVMPCAGALACALSGTGGGGLTGGATVSTFSDMAFFSSTSVAPRAAPQDCGEPDLDREGGVVDCLVDCERRPALRNCNCGCGFPGVPGRGGGSNRAERPMQAGVHECRGRPGCA